MWDRCLPYCHVFYLLVSAIFLTFCFVVLLSLPSALVSLVLLFLACCPWTLKLLQPCFIGSTSPQDPLVFSTPGLLTDSLPTLYTWPRVGLWLLYVLWVQASCIIFDLCFWPDPCHLELSQLSSCVLFVLASSFTAYLESLL